MTIKYNFNYRIYNISVICFSLLPSSFSILFCLTASGLPPSPPVPNIARNFPQFNYPASVIYLGLLSYPIRTTY